MKIKFTILSLLVLLCVSSTSFGQSSVLTIGEPWIGRYNVHFRLTPVSIAAPSSCNSGYTYSVGIDYEIAFSNSWGTAPDSMRKIEGTLSCGSTDLDFVLPNKPDSGTIYTDQAYRSSSDCQTATPLSLSCNALDIDITFPILGTPRTYSYTASPLPVEMTFLHINTEAGFAELTWGTASEKDNDYFEIQRSIDGINWEAIGRVEGNGTTVVGANYDYTDVAPLSGTSYYRLKQVDFNGEFEYSDVLVATFGTMAGGSAKVYPNPTKDKITIEGVSASENIQVLNAVGKNVTKEVDINTNNSNIECDLVNLPTGIYYVQTSLETIRLIKQ